MFLEKILKSTAERITKIRQNFDFPFEKALKQDGISFICEIKKASPSKGIISDDFSYLDIAYEYEQAGASVISVLTEPDYFLGRDEYLYEISKKIHVPLLRKDFIIDSYQIYEAKILGASAVLLISEILDKDKLSSFIEISHKLGLSALVECHSRQALEKALSAGARIIGVNNRNLETFKVDISATLQLRELIPGDKICVSESGISAPEDIEMLRKYNVDAVLIGEVLMRSPDKKKKIAQLRGL